MVLLYVAFVVFSLAFKILSLPLAFGSVVMMNLAVDLFGFISFGTLCAS